jgi:hypothetical protein
MKIRITLGAAALAALYAFTVFPSCSGESGAGDGGTPDGSTADAGDAGADAGKNFPKCGTYKYDWQGIIPGPNDPGTDADLNKLARAYDRTYLTFNAAPLGTNTDATVLNSHPENRTLIEKFIRETDSWDFTAYSGKDAYSIMDGFGDTVGMYGGAGAAAEAFRYGTLRDRGEDCDEIALAKQNLVRVLDVLHVATDITGVPGMIARSVTKRSIKGWENQTTTPLFDKDGNPLPTEKNNGTMREDNSGRYPGWLWNDSCSRDMLVGWAQAYGAAWEVIRDDPAFDQSLKARLQADARAIGTSLSIVRESGYDLEIRDPDGRRTFHGNLNENSVDTGYVDGAENGFYAIMALGIVGAFAYVSEDPELDDYLQKKLITKRKLDIMSRDKMKWVDMGIGSNFSNYNMAFTGGLLAIRYVPGEASRKILREAVEIALYAVPDRDRQPSEMKQSFFDFIYASAVSGASAFSKPEKEPDSGALQRGIETLKGFPSPPYWDSQVINCDDDEIASKSCTALDGTHLDLLGFVGRGDTLVAKQPVPMKTRPPSNYFWRSNPYEPNGGGNGERLIPAVDFRMAYWLGRWTRR